MKGYKTILITAALITAALITASCFVPVNEDDSGFYASRAEQDEIYSLLQKESYSFHKTLEMNGWRIVKETIAPIYRLDMLDYAQTGEIRIRPRTSPPTNDSEEKGNVYAAKMVTSGGAYAGNVVFRILNGAAEGANCSLVFDINDGTMFPNYSAPYSYADHLNRIKAILHRTDPVPAEDVKLVSVDGMCRCFCVRSQGGYLFIPVGSVYTEPNYGAVGDLVWDENDMMGFALEYRDKVKKDEKNRAAWEAEHPGETYSVTGSLGLSDGGICSQFDNVLDVDAYLRSAISPRTSSSSLFLIIGCSAGGAVLIGVLIFAAYKTLRKKRRDRSPE